MWLIDKFSRVPIYEQIITGIETDIANGTAHAGDRLPSLRELSVNLGLNPNTIQKAYADLMTRGVIQSAPGLGYYIADAAHALVCEKKADRLSQLSEVCADLRMAGIPLETVLQTVKTVYEEGKEQ